MNLDEWTNCTLRRTGKTCFAPEWPVVESKELAVGRYPGRCIAPVSGGCRIKSQREGDRCFKQARWQRKKDMACLHAASGPHGINKTDLNFVAIKRDMRHSRTQPYIGLRQSVDES